MHRGDVASSPGPAKRRRFSRLKDFAVAVTSLGIVLHVAQVAYAATSTPAAWAFSVQRGQKNGSRPRTEVLYGKATDTNGKAVKGVQIRLLTNRHTPKPLAILVSGPAGTYRHTLSLHAGTYVLSVVKGGGHHQGSGTTQNIYLAPGNSYRADVHLKRSGQFFFLLPISSY